MLRPLSLLPALVAVAATAAPALVLALSLAPPAVAAPTVGDEDPLQVTIERLTPGEVPVRGPVRMEGTVTNVSDERWRAVNVHAFVGYGPMTTAAELAEARDLPADTEVGTRIFIPGTFDGVGGLAPGQSASYTVELKRGQIPATEPGVYWFGAHALGNTTEVRDAVADGRARTFLPLLPPDTDARVDASVVIPLRHEIQYSRSGRVLAEPGWAADLAPRGHLRELVDLGRAARNRPITWLVDPALPEVVQRLVEGNGPRALDGSPDAGPVDPDASPSEGGSDSSPDSSSDSSSDGATESPSGSSSTAPQDQTPAAPGPASAPGEAWLERLDGALGRGRVLSLPYGDVDVSAAHDHAPALLRQARLRAGDRLVPPDVPTLPAVASPTGYLSTEALTALPDDTTVVLTDLMLPQGAPARPYVVDGRRVLFAASDVSAGGPGPDDPYGTVAVRQRILAEAAVRLVGDRRTPLVVVLPQRWSPERPQAFWRGLRVPWLSLADPTTLPTDERELAAEDLDYPPEQRAAELPALNFATAQQVVEAGQVLANVLTDNDEVDREVADEVLASLSYGSRRDAEQVRARAGASLTWLERRNGGVRVQAPPGVTLSSANGGFATTVSNRLDQPVTISLKAITDASLSVDTPPTIDLAARGSQTVVLDVRASSPGVHYVRLIVTDDTGAPLGSSATLPVRSSQVSQVIWLILGVGVGLLFVAIAVRLVRRVRSDGA